LIILSHRGYWLSEAEKNSTVAFERSFELGFGVETDIRDYQGELVISHDLADQNSLSSTSFFELYKRFSSQSMLALNIKADGLQVELKRQLGFFKIDNYFIFDMAVPDGLSYLRHGMKAYTRQSEYEVTPSFYDLATGIWLDEFHDHWLTDNIVQQHILGGKGVCIVSPELHKRPYAKEWLHYRDLERKLGKDTFMLCTDFPEKAKEFFNA